MEQINQNSTGDGKKPFAKDLASSLVVFLVAMPLALGIALASGAPSVLAGLIGCVVGGIVVGLVGGAPLQVSGPAAGLTVIVYGLVHKFGWPATCAITLCAGLVQIAFGFARIARVCLAITPSVVHGMLAGIGVVIALAQVHIVLGGDPESSALLNLKALPEQVLNLHGHATFLGLLTIAILIGWQRVPKKLKIIPGALVAVLTSTLISNLAWFDVKRVTLPENLTSAFSLPQFPLNDMGGFIVAVLTVALVASVESLLCAVATDKLHTGPRANLDRELIGQGAGNAISGLIGGLPITGVIVRSAANVSAGAQTRFSSVYHGIWIVLFVAFFSSLIERVPLAALAGLLVYVGMNLVKLHDIRELNHHREGVVYFVTLFGVAFINLLAGVGLGIGLSAFLLLRRLATMRAKVEERGDRWHARIEGSASFISVPDLTAVLARIPAGAKVDIDLAVDFMDHAAFEALHGWRVQHEKMGGTVDIDETHEEWYQSAATGVPLGAKSERQGVLGGLRALLRRRKARNMQDLVDGAREFQRAAESERPAFSRLANGQSPHVLFITCADSRVVPNVITATKPGDLFTLQNIGNMVPHPDAVKQTNTDESVPATLEYAVDVLGVENIIVCGHSECGAMKAVLEGKDLTEMPGLHSWLRHGEGALERLQAGENPDGAQEPHNRLSQLNVLQQLDNLRAHPVVQRKLSAGTLHLWGWYFDIEHAQVYVFQPETNRFAKVGEPSLSPTGAVQPEPRVLAPAH